MKYECKKHEREYYSAKESPSVLTVPGQNFVMISGKGDPSGEEFSEKVGILYSLAYPIKMNYKSTAKNADGIEYDDYAVFPLEGVWTAPNAGDRDEYAYTLMIRQPDFITKEMYEAALASARKKDPHPLLQDVAFGRSEDGLCIQALHIGPFSNETETFAKMDLLAEKNGLERMNRFHREVYLSDPRRVAPENYKTILRYQVRHK